LYLNFDVYPKEMKLKAVNSDNEALEA